MGSLFTRRTLLVILGFVLAMVVVGLIVGLHGHSEGQDVEAQPWINHRLPSNLIPLHYDLRLFPDFYDNHTRFNGSVTIRIKVTMATKYLLVHFKSMNITETILRVDGRPTQIDALFPYESNQYWVIQTSVAMATNSVAEVTMKFDGSLNNGLAGLYRSTYLNSDTGLRRYLVSSKFQPTDARKAFPCLDEPGLKSTFTVSLIHRPEYTALSNMPPVETTPYGLDGFVETKFQESVPMVTYLACFVVSDFAFLNGVTKSGVPFRVFTTPDRINQAEYSLDFGIKALDYFTEYFGVPYPLPKMDMIAIPDFVSGAMEHWGLITYRENNMLFDEHISSPYDKQRVSMVVAHEISHMWFGNLVTMHWWNDLWLNEGFASYMEYKALEHIHPDWNVSDEFLISDLMRVMAKDAAVTSHPIVVPVSHPDQINEVFDFISYSKGASVIRMLEAFMGHDEFKTGIRKYMKNFQFKTTVTDDLWHYLNQISSPDVDGSAKVKAIMDTWTRQMGYPVIRVEYEESSLTLSQRRFLLDPNADSTFPPSEFNYIWKAPVTYVTSEGRTDLLWLNSQQETYPLPQSTDLRRDWIKFNINQTGYYIVDYPLTQWRQFGEIIGTDQQILGTADRANLIGDIFALAKSGQRPYSLAFHVANSLCNETEYVPWRAFSMSVSYVSIMLYSSVHFGQWQSFMLSLVSPALKRLNDGHEANAHLEAVLLSLACLNGEEETLTHVTNLFQLWITNPEESSIPNGLRSVIYAHGMYESGNAKEWDVVWHRYQTAVVPQEKRRLLQTLTRTRRVWLLNRLLSYSLDETKIRGQDFFLLLIYLDANRVAGPLLWDWIRTNWQLLVNRFGTHSRYLGRLVPSIVSSFNTEFQLQQVKEFWEQYPEGGAGERGRSQALEKIRANIAWMKSNEDVIGRWLSRHNVH